MKKALLILTIIFTYQINNAQGTLQFNTVINKQLFSTGTHNSGGSKEFASFTVPDGKIWKVKFLGVQITKDNIPSTDSNQRMLLKDSNGTHFFVYIRDGNGGNQLKEEIFLKSGSYSVLAPSWQNSNDTGVGLSINGIEYNIIPN